MILVVEVRMRVYGLSPEQLDALWVSLRAGESLRSIARHHRVPLQHVRRYFAQTGCAARTAGGQRSEGEVDTHGAAVGHLLDAEGHAPQRPDLMGDVVRRGPEIVPLVVQGVPVRMLSPAPNHVACLLRADR
jgi:hypothetical protein